MLMFVWLCVMSSLMPGGSQIATMQAAAFQAHLRAQLEMPEPEPAAFGAARHVVHYAIPAFAR